MSGTVGIELTATELRGVKLRAIGKAVARSAVVPCDPSRLPAAVAELRAALGGADRLAVAIGVSLLELKRVQLPPAPLVERERMLQLEPDRYFAASDAALVTALDDVSSVAFAVSRDDLESWLGALQAWAPIARVEAAPVAIARAVTSSGYFTLEDDAAVVELRDRRLRSARRLAPPADRNGARPLASEHGLPAALQVAYGAARGVAEPLTGQLLTPERRRTVVRDRRRAVWQLGVVAAGAVLLAGWSYERWQQRTLAALAREAGRLTANATPALHAQSRLLAQGTEIALLRDGATSPPRPLDALAALSTALPPDVILTSARMQGDAWQIDGSARDASRLVPLLDQSGRFANVRSVAATSRFTDAGKVRESFSVSFTMRHAP